MPKVTNYDVLTFFYCVLAGVALSIFADMLRALRKYCKFGGVSAFIADLFFCITAAVVTFLMQLIYSNGSIRFYILFGELCGFSAARVIISPLSNRLFRLLYKIICTVIRPIKSFLSTVIRLFCGLCKKICEKLRPIAKNILKCAGGLVYNISNSMHRNNAVKTRKSDSKAERSRGKKKKKRKKR